MTRTISVGLIGAGRIGRVHAEHLAYSIPEATPVMVADIDADSVERCARRYGIDEAVEDYRAVIDDDRIDAVVICSSTDTHTEMIVRAAEAGKHIFCEKPIAFTLEEIDEAIEAVERAGVKFQVGFNRRFDPSFRRVKELVETGEVGEPHLLHLVSRDPAPPTIDYIKRSGGLFFDMTIHDFDMARYLIGSEVEHVYAVAGVKVDPTIGEAGDVDTAVITLHFENGVMGTIDNSRQASYGYDQRAEVFGSKGSVRSGNLYPNTVVISNGEYVGRDLPLNFFMERYVESYRAEMQAFVDAIREDRPVPVGGADGRISVVMSVAARQSYELGQPVRLEDVEELIHD